MKPPNANETPKCHAHGLKVLYIYLSLRQLPPRLVRVLLVGYMAKLMFFWCVQNRGIPHRGCLADKINQPLEIDQNKKCWGSTIYQPLTF
jgi:hypothetical protein